MANKGLSIRIEELKLKIAQVINESELPLSISKLIVTDILNMINEGYKNELDRDQREYEQALEKESEENKDK